MGLVGKVFIRKDEKVTARVVRVERDDVYLVSDSGLKGIVSKERLYELYNEKAESEEITPKNNESETPEIPETPDAQAESTTKTTTKTTTKRGNK